MRRVVASPFGTSMDQKAQTFVCMDMGHCAVNLRIDTVAYVNPWLTSRFFFRDVAMRPNRHSNYLICWHGSGRYMIRELRTDGSSELLIGSFDSADAAEQWILGRCTKCSGAVGIANSRSSAMPSERAIGHEKNKCAPRAEEFEPNL
ncbi:hypothetical protein Q3C01_24060 [Bradyrhizobium sp. UFLA05-109]